MKLHSLGLVFCNPFNQRWQKWFVSTDNRGGEYFSVLDWRVRFLAICGLCISYAVYTLKSDADAVKGLSIHQGWISYHWIN